MAESNVIKFIRFPVGRLAEVIKMDDSNKKKYQHYFDIYNTRFEMPFLDNIVIFAQNKKDPSVELPFNRILTDVLGDVEPPVDGENPLANKMVAHSQPYFGDVVMCAVKDGQITTMSEKQLRKYMMYNGLPQGIANLKNGQTVFTYKPIIDDDDQDD